MNGQSVTRAFILAAALLMAIGSAQAFDDSKYPNLKGQWERFVVRGVPGQPSFDQTKGWGALQGAPLTPEYQAIFEENVKEQDAGGLGLGADHARCVAAGMPFIMVAFRPLEFIVTPETTYIIIADYDPLRRIFTDGRDWPKEIEPTFQGCRSGNTVRLAEVCGTSGATHREDAAMLPSDQHRDAHEIFVWCAGAARRRRADVARKESIDAGAHGAE